MRRPHLAILVALLVVTAASAEAAFCKKRNGAAFFRDRCKRREVEVDLAAVAGAPKGDPGPKGQSQPRLRAVDANGIKVPGTFDTIGTFVYRTGSRPLGIDLGRDGFTGGYLRFEGSLCTEGALVRLSDDQMYDTVPVIGETAYSPADPIETHSMLSYSYPYTLDECSSRGGLYNPLDGRCCLNSATSARAGPPTPLDLSGFTPPFHVEIEE